jgi:transcriptional regulator with XRE-family HTH domain
VSPNAAPHPVAPGLIGAARRSARLSQAELARRAGLPRSVLCAYERGRREPGAEALVAVLTAAGQDLTTVTARRPDAERAGRILAQVLDLAEALPSRRRGELGPSPWRQVRGNRVGPGREEQAA